MENGRHGRVGAEAARAAVREAAAEAVRRISRRSPAWWRTETADGRTRADAVVALVGDLAELGQSLEGLPARRPARPPRENVLADQLTVVAYDLVAALAADETAGDTAGATAGATALAHLLLTTYEVDPRPVPSDAVEMALRAGGPLRERLDRLPRLGER